MFSVLEIHEAKELFEGSKGKVAFGLEPGDMTLYELFIMRWGTRIIFGKVNAGTNGVIAARPGDNIGPGSFGMIGCEHTRKVMADVFHMLTGWSDNRELNWVDGRIIR